MKEVKSPKKPLIYYYGIALLAILVFNLIVSPLLLKSQVSEVDYGTFMQMIEDKEIGQVEFQTNQIVFTDKENTAIFKTGLIEDPTLTQRLYESGAKFSAEIVEQDEDGWIVTAEVFGKGIGMWLRSQGENIKLM